ncbi:LOW QUALITY PROTEIN: hypothetical protein CVT26_014642 [Gymnopilus dilepis]|uniref:AMP-dependent synthetase/ligase domain-containing protein n=1 Tax=Gymnopilus dilepis TaxID=231916 RepID=A0A409W3M1_9AGAR|nr:LOW QUALITY PROTEIN: hypothetical protein CVT26_014642 [Gymnopilus dilepis]
MFGPVSISNDHFNPPPKELPVEFVFDFHLKYNQKYPVVVFPVNDNEASLGSYTYQEFVPAIHRFGWRISSAINLQLSAEKSSASPVVAILLRAVVYRYDAAVFKTEFLLDAMTSLIVIAGVMRAGIIPFPISPLIAQLLKNTRPKGVIFDERTRVLAEGALEEFTKSEKETPVMFEVPPLSSLFPGHNVYDALPTFKRLPESVSVICHSSSSSSLYPKVVHWSSSLLTHHGGHQAFPVRNLSGQVLGAFGLEVFHSMGMVVFFVTLRQGLILGIMNPTERSSILPADPNKIFRSFELTKPHLFLTNPRALEVWNLYDILTSIMNPCIESFLKIFGGRFLSKSVGDKYVMEGVKLRAGYVASLDPFLRFGQDRNRPDSSVTPRESTPIACILIAKSFPDFQGLDWEYWTVYPRPDVKFIPRDDGLFELIVTAPDKTTPLPLTNTTLSGEPACNSGDILMAHPTKPHTYKMFGRSSDQIMLATGEVVSQAYFGIQSRSDEFLEETELSKHPLVSSVVMFGHTRPTVGLIIEPSVSGRELATTKELFVDHLWSDVSWRRIQLFHLKRPIINTFNQSSPSHMKISRKMVVMANPEKPISMSPKGLPRRPVVWHDYDDEISALYKREIRSML